MIIKEIVMELSRIKRLVRFMPAAAPLVMILALSAAVFAGAAGAGPERENARQAERGDITNPSGFNVWFHTFTSRTISRSFYQSYVEGLNLKGNERVLDFGSGSGAEAVHIAEILSRKGGRLTCLDISPAWLESARKRLAGWNNVDFILGDITQLEIPEGSFDIIVVHFVLHDIDGNSRAGVVRALARVLRSGGTLFIREPEKEGHGMPADEIRLLMAAAELREESVKRTKSFFIGTMTEGVFEK
jgi:ubiquinone/menaquinone biosynthesis C-methylase UbiE